MTGPITEDRYGPMPGELGRRFTEHDDGNLRYLTAPLLDAAQISDDEDVFWPFPNFGGPYPLDQLKEGSCTGHGAAHELAVGPVWVTGMDNAAGLELYRLNQEEDRRAGRVFESGATVQGTCKALLRANRITGYLWNRGVRDTMRALSVGPVALGLDWSNAQYKTRADGLVVVDDDWVGGHFIVLCARQTHPKYGRGAWWVNTWGRSYGVPLPQCNVPKGAGFVPEATLDLLLSRQGESVSLRDHFVAPPVEPTKPEPVPAPVPPVVPTPPPPPGPTPTPPAPQPRRPKPGDKWSAWVEWFKWQQQNRKP